CSRLFGSWSEKISSVADDRSSTPAERPHMRGLCCKRCSRTLSVNDLLLRRSGMADTQLAFEIATHGLCWCSVAGDSAGEPSDQRRTGINSTVGSNGLPSTPRMDEASSPAAQATAWPYGTKSIT